MRLRNEECSNAYYHVKFLRGRPDLLDVSLEYFYVIIVYCPVTYFCIKYFSRFWLGRASNSRNVKVPRNKTRMLLDRMEIRTFIV